MSQKKVKLLKKYLVKKNAFDKYNVLKIKTGIDKEGKDVFTVRPQSIWSSLKNLYKKANRHDKTKLKFELVKELIK